jgi:hypothetical protein
MRQQSKHQGWRLYKSDLLPKVDPCVSPACGELIQFAQLSREKAATLEIQKSLHELLIKINKTQDAKRLQLGLRLHDRLSRSLAMIQLDRSPSLPPLEEHVQQIRTLLMLVYPISTGVESPEKPATPFGRSTGHESDLPLKKHRDRSDSRPRSG